MSHLRHVFNFLAPHVVFYTVLGLMEALYASGDGGMGTALMAVGLHAAVGLATVPLAFLAGGFHIVTRGRFPKIHIGIWLAAGTLAVAAVASFLSWYIWHKGIIISAIEPRPLVSLAVGMAFAGAVGFAAWRWRRPGLVSALGLGVLAVFVVAGFGTRSAAKEGAEILAAGPSTSGILARTLRARADSDGDGYPTLWCFETCDCDDSNEDISPVAVEIPGNGIDDDCADGDLSIAEIESPAEEPETAPEPTAKPLPKVRNVLLITIDTLRADHLGCYGYERNTSPRMDELAASGVRFDQARAQGPMTRFSVPSLMTGRYFSELERSEGQWPRVYDSNLLVSEIFNDAGYHTAAFHSIGYLVPLFGLSQGFDVYDVSVVRDRAPVHWKPTSDLLTDRILAHVDKNVAALPEGTPWFLWTYYGDPHSGYIRHDGLPDFGPSIFDVYDQEIYFTDIHLGRMLDGLRKRGMLDDTVIVLTSDHGEGLEPEDDHGFQYHGQTLYDNLLRVPLLVVMPGVEPRVVTRPVGNIDVMPTLLQVTGQAAPEGTLIHGRSLVGLMQGTTDQHPPTFSEKVTTNVIPQKSMVDWPYKIIWKIGPNRFELYNLEKDPDELTSLHKDEPEVLAKLKARIQRWRASELKERKGHKSKAKP